MSSFDWDESWSRPSKSQIKRGLAMDVVLAILGGIIVALAWQNLRFGDPRPLRDAWTYVVGVPLTLLVTDILLKTVVSRFVERTVQFGFLMSVLIHLVISLGAGRIVVLSQHVTDVDELKLATSDQMRQSSIPEYMHAVDDPEKVKPDYMRPVPTADTQAAEAEQAKLEVEIPKNLPALAEVPEPDIETPVTEVEKVETKPIEAEPEVLSETRRLDRPELAARIEANEIKVDLPEQPAREAIYPSEPEMSLEAKRLEEPNRASRQGEQSPDMTPLEALAFDVQPSKVERTRASQNLRRTALEEFDIPSIEDRKVELTKPDLASGDSRTPPADASNLVKPIPIPDTPHPEWSNAPLRDRMDAPSASGELTKSQTATRNRREGEQSAAVFDGLPLPGNTGLPSRFAPSSPVAVDRTQDVQGALIPPQLPAGRPSEGLGRPSRLNPIETDRSIPVPSSPGGEAATVYQNSPATEIERPAGDAQLDRPASRPASGRSKPWQDLAIEPDGLQPSADVDRATRTSVASAAGRRGGIPEIEPSFELFGRELAPRLPRLPSAQPSLHAPAVPIPAPAFQQRIDRNDSTVATADLGEFGPATEAAIERGLEFLARFQRPDGSWRFEDFEDQPRLRSDTAATALALLSFQGAGYSHQQYHYAPVCKSALDFLMAHQKPDGDFYIPMDESSDLNLRFYSHSIATLAICEAYGMTQDDAIRESAQRAILFMAETQDPVGGGWRYVPGLESDTSVSGWFMMALKSAELAGLEVPEKVFDGIQRWLDIAQASPTERHLYRYNPFAPDAPLTRHGRVPNPTMTGVGLLMRLYFGWKRDNPDMIRGSEYLLENLPKIGTTNLPQRDTYYWYYATQVLFHMGGDYWKRWNSQLHPLLIQSQTLNGDLAGSWDAAKPIPDRWGPFAGRLYVTTLNLLSLEVYYRHLPIYEETAK